MIILILLSLQNYNKDQISRLKKKSDKTQQLSAFFESRTVVTEQFWEHGVMAYVSETEGDGLLVSSFDGDLVQFFSKALFLSLNKNLSILHNSRSYLHTYL